MFLFQPIEHCLSLSIFSKLIVLPVKDIYDTLREWKKCRGSDRHSGSEFALATLIRVKGIKLSLAGRTHVDLPGRKESQLPERRDRTTLECGNMPALLKQ